jgi:hypothetical protein
LSPDQLGIALFPQRLVLVRSSGGLRRRLVHKEALAFAPAEAGVPAWQAATDALAEKVSRATLPHVQVKLILSSHFVHYLVIPWRDGLSNQEEEWAYARHCFERVHGSDAAHWKLRLCSDTPGEPRLACAVEPALIEALRTHLSPLGRRYRSLQPHLMACFNSCRAQMGKDPTWLVVAEPGLLCLARLQDGYWHSINRVKVGPDWPNELPRLLEREEYMLDCATPCLDVVLIAPDATRPLVLPDGKWRITTPMPAMLAGMSDGADAPFSIALAA